MTQITRGAGPLTTTTETRHPYQAATSTVAHTTNTSYGGALFPQHARLLADSAQQLQLINIAARLVAEIGDRAEREARIAAAAWRAGYRAGFAAGEDVGYGRAHEEIAEAWREVAEHVRAYGRPGLDPYHELRRRRYQPGGEAYLAALARRGGREYTGGPVQWDVPVGGAA
ncbi:MAG TPA: hypothetical protein VIK91_05705 [Nannocystis sp.]